MLPGLTQAQQQVKGTQLLMTLKTIESVQNVEAGDTIIMSCPKRKDTYATVVTKSLKGMQQNEIKKVGKHMCPTCSTTIKTEGVGKNAKDKVVHTCNSCGSEEVTCCLMKKNGGPTMGMEGDKK